MCANYMEIISSNCIVSLDVTSLQLEGFVLLIIVAHDNLIEHFELKVQSYFSFTIAWIKS
jgi:hypothetical protein